MMTAFTMSVLDDKTRMEIILKGASYNQACFFLDRIMPREEFIGCKGNRTNITIVYKTRTFVYDEVRGLLLGK